MKGKGWVMPHVSAQQRVEREYTPATAVVGRENDQDVFGGYHQS
jgi:hypothetical protein